MLVIATALHNKQPNELWQYLSMLNVAISTHLSQFGMLYLKKVKLKNLTKKETCQIG